MKSENINLTAFYKVLSDKSSIGIHAINLDGQTLIYNEKMMQIEGLNLDDIHDRSILDVFRFNTSEQSTLLRVLQTQTAVMHVKQQYWNKNGHEITTINDTYPVFQEEELIGAIEFSRDITALEKLAKQPLQKYGERVTLSSLTAASAQMQQVIKKAEKVSLTKLQVLLIGESGTGKDLIAEGIHHTLEQPLEQFITVYCNRYDETVIETLEQRFVDLPKSTIFCERIEYLTLGQQEQLFALLSRHANEHLFIASVGDDPVSLISNGQLLKELYYFFASIAIHIPPLRERMSDLKPFVQDYFQKHRQLFNSSIEGMSDEVEALFLNYSWPGNLKELELLLDEMTTLLTEEELITYDLLPQHFKLKVQEFRTPHLAEDFVIHANEPQISLEQYLQKAESYYLNKMLEKYDNNITKAAGALGMSRQNLQYRLKKMKKST